MSDRRQRDEMGEIRDMELRVKGLLTELSPSAKVMLAARLMAAIEDFSPARECWPTD